MARKTGSQATTTTLTQDVKLAGSEFLTVLAQAGPTATAAGDITLTVQQYVDAANTGDPVLAPINIPTLETSAAVLVGGIAYVWARFRVSGISKAQIQAKNNNVGTLPVEIDFDLG